MTNKDEIKFWKKAIKILEKGYGKNVCEDFKFECVECQSRIVIGFLWEHIDSLNWTIKQDKVKRKILKKGSFVNGKNICNYPFIQCKSNNIGM